MLREELSTKTAQLINALQENNLEFLITYALQKAQAAGKDESYLPYLLPDIVREYFFRSYINSISRSGAKI